MPNSISPDLTENCSYHHLSFAEGLHILLMSVMFAEGFSVKAHLLNSYRKALAAILKCQLVPIRSRQGGRQAFEAFAVDEDMHALGQYLGAESPQILTVSRTLSPTKQGCNGRGSCKLQYPCWAVKASWGLADM